MKKNVLSILFIITLAGLSCSDPIPIQKTIISKDDLPTVEIENMKSNFTENGIIKGKLQAVILQQFDGIVEPYVDFPKGIVILLYNKEGQIETSLSANRAIYYQNKRSWEAIGNVVISNINGDVLRTKKLYGDEKEKKIFTDQFVQIAKADGSIIKGNKGFESNTEFTIYQFINVNGRITFKDEFLGVPEDSIGDGSDIQLKSPNPTLPKPIGKPEKN